MARIYGRRMNQCGATAKGVFWRDEKWQTLRFERLCGIFEPADLGNGGITINDLGCGYGALFEYIADWPLMTGSQYFGYDITQEMIAAGRDRITDPRAKFIRHMQATQQADYSIASGTYNMHGNADEKAWMTYVETSLKQLWAKTDKALAFNMLREDETEQYDGLYYIDPEYMRRFCQKHLSENVEMFNERPMPDVTFFVRR